MEELEEDLVARSSDTKIQEEPIKTTHEAHNTINSRKIIKISANQQNFNLNSKNDEISLLQIVDCKDLNDVLQIIQNLSLENAPNIFAFVVEVKSSTPKEIKRFHGEICKKFDKNRSLVLQITHNNSHSFYVKPKNEDFKALTLNLGRASLIEQMQCSKFTIETLLNILNLKNCSIIDANLSEVYLFLDLKENYQNLFTLAISNCDEVCFRFLKLFDVNLSLESHAEILNSVIRSNHFDFFLALFGVFKPEDVTKEDIDKSIKDPKTVFLTSVEIRNIEVVKLMLTFNENSMDFFNTWKSAWYLALDREYFDICEELKKCNVNFSPIEESLRSQLVSTYEKILEDISKFHKSIQDGNLLEVKKFSESRPKLKLAYGKGQVCALELSILHRKFEVYAFLRANGFYTDKSTQLWDEIEQLLPKEKREIRVENLKYTITNPDAFIGILLSKCSFDACSSLHFDEVRQMLMDLSKIIEFRPVMEIVALSDVKIVFDFKTESVKSMDPTRNEHTLGIAYFEQNLLFVGKNANKNQRYGTFAHELTHFALYLLFENRCLPYAKDDAEREEKWIQIVENIRQVFVSDFGGTDNIIRWVFECYDVGYEQQAELIVRVNDLLAYYFDNPDKIEQLRKIYAEIFDFYIHFVLPDLNTEGFLIKNMNNDFKFVTSLFESDFKPKTINSFLIKSNVPHLSIVKLHQTLSSKSKNSLRFKIENIFMDSKQFCEMSQDTSRLLNSKMIKRVVIDASNCSKGFISFNAKNKLRADVEYFVVVSKDYEDEDLQDFQTINEEFMWKDLDEDSKNSILSKKVKFQGQSKKLSDLIPKSTFSCEFINEVRNDERIIINKSKSPEVDGVFIERKFSRGILKLSLDELIESVENERVILISDVAGSGKTLILSKIKEELIKKYENNFIVSANFLEFTAELLNPDFKDFPTFVCNKILKMKSLIEKTIFHHLYSQGLIKVLLDGFDEASVFCKENAIKLFKIQDQGQLWITTRDYLEENLEQELNVKSYKLLPYSIEDQKHFTVEFWKKNTEADQTLIEDCADLLVTRLKLLLSKSLTGFLGIPLVLRAFAEYYREKLSVDFKNLLKHSLKLSQVYEELIDSKTVLWSSMTSIDPSNFHNKSTTLRVLYRYFALRQFLNLFQRDIFGIIFIAGEWDLKEISKAGIIRCESDSDKEVGFIHRTFAEKFVSEFVMKSFESLDNSWMYLDAFVDFLIQILTEERFKIVRFFLNELIHEVEVDSKSFQGFKDKFDKKLEENGKLSELILRTKEESTYNLAVFFTNTIQSLDVADICISFVSDQFNKSMEEIDFYFSNIFKFKNQTLLKFLLQSDKNGHPCFFYFLKDFYDQILIKFVEKGFSKAEIREIFHRKNEKGEHFIHFALENFTSDKFNEAAYFLKNSMELSELMSELLTKNDLERNLLLFAATLDGKIPCMIDFMSEILSTQMLKSLIEEFDRNGENFLSLMMKYQSLESIPVIMEKIKQIFITEPKLKHFLLVTENSNQNLISKLLHLKNAEDFVNFFHEIYLKSLDVVEFIREMGIVPALLMDIFRKFDDKPESSGKSLSNFLKHQYKKESFLNLAIKFIQNQNFFEFVIKAIEIHESVENVNKMLMKLDKNGKLPLFKILDNSGFFDILFKFYEKSLTNRNFGIVLELLVDFKKNTEIREHRELIEEVTKDYLDVNLAEFYSRMRETLYSSDVYNIFSKFNGNFIRRTELKEYFKCQWCQEMDFLTSNAYILKSSYSFDYFWNLYEVVFSREEILQILFESKHHIFYEAGVNSMSKDMFKHVIQKVLAFIDNEEKIREFILLQKPKYEKPLISHFFCSNERFFVYLFINVHCKYFHCKDFIYETDSKGETFLHKLAKFGSHVTLERVLMKLQIDLTSEELINFLKLQNKNNENVFHCFASNINRSLLEYFIKFIKSELKKEQYQELLNDFFKGNFSIFHSAIAHEKLENFKILFDFYGENFSFAEAIKFFQINDKQSVEESEKICNLICNDDLLQFIASKVDEPFMNFFMVQIFESGSLEKLKFFLKNIKCSVEHLENLITFRTLNDENFLHISGDKSDEFLSFFLDFLKNEIKQETLEKLLYSFDDKYFLPLHSAVMSGNIKNLKILFDCYEENFSVEKINNILEMKVGEETSKNILEITENVEIQEFISEKIKMCKTKQNFKQHPDFKSIWDQNGSFLNCLSSKEEIMMFCNANIDVFHKFIKTASILALEFAFNDLKYQLEEQELKEIFNLKAKSGKNIFHFAAENKNEKSITFFKEFVTNEFNKEELRAFLSERDQYDYLPFNFADDTEIDENMRVVRSMYYKNFTRDELKKLLDL